jgi:hypothetical protein
MSKCGVEVNLTAYIVRIPGINLSNFSAIKVTPEFQPSTPKMGTTPRGESFAAVDIKHTLHITVEFENILRGVIPDPLEFKSNLVVGKYLEFNLLLAGVNRREVLGMLDICPHLVPVLPYETVAGSENWIPEYVSAEGRSVVAAVDPIKNPPDYSAIVEGKEDLEDEDVESDEEKYVNANELSIDL